MDFMSLFGSLFSGIMNLIGLGVQNSAQREANKQMQDFAKSESELAYQRSTPASQVSQFVSAGLSPEQARQVVAGAASPGTYTPASPVDQMQGIDYASMLTAFNPLAQQMSDLYTQSAAADDGGLIGQHLSDPAIKTITQHLGELPLYASTSLSGFLRYVNSADAPDWCKSDDFKKSWNDAVSSRFGRSALMNYFKNSTSLEVGSKQAITQTLNIRGAELSNTLKEIEINDDSVNFVRDLIQLNADSQVIPQQTKTTLKVLKKQFEEASLDLEYLTDPEYRKHRTAFMLSDQESQYLVAAALALRAKGSYDYLQQPGSAYMVGVLDVLNGVGLTDTEFGSIVSYMEASGIPVVPTLHRIVKSLPFDEASSAVGDGVRRMADQTVNKFHAVGEFANEYLSDQAIMQYPGKLYKGYHNYIYRPVADRVSLFMDVAGDAVSDGVRRAGEIKGRFIRRKKK